MVFFVRFSWECVKSKENASQKEYHRKLNIFLPNHLILISFLFFDLIIILHKSLYVAFVLINFALWVNGYNVSVALPDKKTKHQHPLPC